MFNKETAGYIEARVSTTPLAYAAQASLLLAQPSDVLAQTIGQFVESNPLVEYAPKSGDYLPDDILSNIAHSSPSLQEALFEDFSIIEHDRDKLRVGWFIISSLDPDGYLREDEEVLMGLAQTNRATFLKVLRSIQAMEPRGIAARNLAECLDLQIVGEASVELLAKKIVKHHLSEMARGDLRLAGVSDWETAQACDLIRSLNPRPGRIFDNTTTHYIRPDIQVDFSNTEPNIKLINQPNKLILSPFYNEYMCEKNQDDRQFIRANLAQARALISAIEQRENTLMRIAYHTVHYQKEYLKTFSVLDRRKLICNDIAQELELNISTVSRAIKGKYIQCASRTIPLHSLITSGGCSGIPREQIVDRIKELLLAEPELSDQSISDRLAKSNIRIARRTVNKYRNQFIRPKGDDYA